MNNSDNEQCNAIATAGQTNNIATGTYSLY